MADKTEFLQAFDDAILDAGSLERFINGSEDETVLTRLSAEYPTLQKALKELFENGGIAGRFKTLVQLQSSPLVDGDYALVADDTDAKNGIYIKEGGSWVKSKYDVRNEVFEYINSLVTGVEYIKLSRGNISTSGDYQVSSVITYTPKMMRVSDGDKLVIKKGTDGYNYQVVRYGVDGTFISKSAKYFQSAEVDREIALFDGLVRIVVTGSEPDTREELFKRDGTAYILYNKAKREYEELDSGISSISLSLPLEAGRLEREGFDTRFTAVGRINPASDINADYNFLAERRTPKFLKVIGGSSVLLSHSDGVCFVFEYDMDMRCSGYFSPTSGEENTLRTDTCYLKVSLEQVVESHPVISITYDSKNDRPEWVLNRLESNRTNGNLNFYYEVFTNEGRGVVNSGGVEQYPSSRYFNTGILKLPPNYDPNGAPVRLIIFVQGSGGFLSFAAGSINPSYESEDFNKGVFNYWLKEGYAILGVFPWTSRFKLTNPVTNLGTPTAMAAYNQAYNWVVENYNISRDGVFVSGKSSGGFCGTLLPFASSIPIRAVGLLAPTITPMRGPFGAYYDARLAYATDMGFEGNHTLLEGRAEGIPSVSWTEELRDYIRQNSRKMLGYNPFWCGIVNVDVDTLTEMAVDGTELQIEHTQNWKRVSTVPFKIWASVDDSVDTYKDSEVFCTSIANAGGIGELRTMPDGTGSHSSVDTSPLALRVPTITTRLGLQHTDAALAVVELVSFFRRFE